MPSIYWSDTPVPIGQPGWTLEKCCPAALMMDAHWYQAATVGVERSNTVNGELALEWYDATMGDLAEYCPR